MNELQYFRGKNLTEAEKCEYIAALEKVVDQQRQQIANLQRILEQYRNYNRRDYRDRSDYLDYEEGIDR